jgi:hypothetical protein
MWGCVASELDELLKFLDTAGVTTSQGVYVSADNLRKWVQGRREVALNDATRARPRTMVQAKRMAARDEEIFPREESTDPFKRTKTGASVPANEPQTTNVPRT